jgi:hypothetical protein
MAITSTAPGCGATIRAAGERRLSPLAEGKRGKGRLGPWGGEIEVLSSLFVSDKGE